MQEKYLKTLEFDKIKEKLIKTRDNIGNKINEVFSGFKKVDEELLENLEEVLIMADLGMDTVSSIISSLRENIKKKGIEEPEKVKEELKAIIVDMIDIEKEENQSKKCILIIGVNGAGKTTTIGKMAKGYMDEGKKVLLVPADTFRAAAGEQIKMWAERAGADITEIKENADPSAVVYSSLEYANERNYDIIIIDTAGRLHNKKNLMEELKKIRDLIFDKFKKEINLKNIIILGPNPDAIKWVNMVYRYNLTIKVLEDYDVFRQFLTELIFNKKYSFNTEKNGKLILTID